MIRFYKIDISFDKGILSQKGFVVAYRFNKDSTVLEVGGDGNVMDADTDLKKLSIETDTQKKASVINGN